MSTWVSNSVEWQEGGFPDWVMDLWRETQRQYPNGTMNPVFGRDQTWYFWEETWTDACGPFPTEAEAQAAIEAYAKTL